MTSPRNWRQIPSNELQTIVNKHEQNAELKALLTRVLVAEGRCPTRLLIDISKALNTEVQG